MVLEILLVIVVSAGVSMLVTMFLMAVADVRERWEIKRRREESPSDYHEDHPGR